MVNLTSQYVAWWNEKKNMIWKDSKFFNFISLTFIGPTYIAKIGACIIIESETPHLP